MKFSPRSKHQWALVSTGLVAFALLAASLCLQAQEVQTEGLNSEAVAPEAASKSQPVLEPRQFSAVAHDAVHRHFLLFGGTYGGQRFDDTWLLEPSGWVLQSPKTHPAARISSAAAYDSLHGQFVLFGGRVQNLKPAMCSPGEQPQHLKTELFCSDTWVFANGNWAKKTTSIEPSAREGHTMAFDAARNQTVLFGGTTGNTSTPLSDTWIWNGTGWKQVFPAHHPPARFWHTMAYDPIRREVVLFGGDGGSQFLNDTWLWNGKDWQAAPRQVRSPELRTNAGMAYDATSQTMVLFSGSVWNSRRVGAPALDAWSWNGEQWKQIAPSKFELISNFSKLTPAQASAATLANATPSVLWMPVR